MGVSGERERNRRCGITELPNCIMESIVSLLPLKDAVNTILASPPQWKHLSHPTLTRRNLELNYLNFYGSKYPTYEETQDFARRVSKYLQQCQGNKVDSLKLQCHLAAESCVSLDEWTRWAITKGVEKLHLRLGTNNDYVFPHRLLVGPTLNLKHLSLERCFLRPPTTDFEGFNRLTTLHLHQVFVDPYLMANLFSVCLVLESLTLYYCCCTNNGSSHLNIVAGDRLTDLKVLHCDEGTKMEISALNLASLVYIKLHYNCHDCRFFSLQTPRLSRIFFSRPMGSGTLLPQALIQFALCPRLETLHLRMAAKLPRISSISTYGNLKQLNLDIILFRILVQEEGDFDVNCVLDLLKAAPLLEELIILVVGGHLFETNPQEMRNHSGFTNDHLKMVKMKGFLGHWYETQLAIGILENAPKLKMLVIDPCDPFEKHYSDDGKYPENYSEQHMAVVEEKLKGVKTDAQSYFYNCLVQECQLIMPISHIYACFM